MSPQLIGSRCGCTSLAVLPRRPPMVRRCGAHLWAICLVLRSRSGISSDPCVARGFLPLAGLYAALPVARRGLHRVGPAAVIDTIGSGSRYRGRSGISSWQCGPAGLVMLLGVWRIGGSFARQPIAGTMAAVASGDSPSPEYTSGPVGSWPVSWGQTERSIADRSFYSFPLPHLAGARTSSAVSRVIRRPDGRLPVVATDDRLRSGVVRRDFAADSGIPRCVANERDCAHGDAIVGSALATMPQWWPDGYALLLRIPGLGFSVLRRDTPLSPVSAWLFSQAAAWIVSANHTLSLGPARSRRVSGCSRWDGPSGGRRVRPFGEFSAESPVMRLGMPIACGWSRSRPS